MKKYWGPAFPCPEVQDAYDVTYYDKSFGLSLRDYFAGQVIMGQSSFLDKSECGLSKKLAEQQAKNAYIFADAMLIEREK